MSIETTVRAGSNSATRHRVTLLAVVLAVTSLVAIPGGLLWPEPAAGGEMYTYADIAPVRDLWWGLLTVLAVSGLMNVPAQAIASMLLVRERGARWVTVGGAMMWIGAAMQAIGVAGWAAAYFYPTDPNVAATAGTAVIDQLNSDSGHLFGVLIPGALLVVLGTVFQAVGLLRSHALPRWVPLLSLTAVLTFVVPGNGALGLLTALPMSAAAIALAYHAWSASR